MPIFSKKYRAFTLAELLLVMAIIGIMSAILFASQTDNKSPARLKAAQREVAATIKLTQAYALQGKRQEYPVGSGTLVSPCGYGFRFLGDDDYEIFYNMAAGAPPWVDCGERNADANGRKHSNGMPKASEQAEAYSLKNGVKLDTSLTPVQDTEFYFTVPHAAIFDRQGQAYSGSRTLIFITPDSSRKDITINSGGYVSESQ